MRSSVRRRRCPTRPPSKYVAGILERPAEAREIMERALRLNPCAPPWFYMNKLRVCYLARDYAAALEAARRSTEAPITRLFEALSLAAVGRAADAASAMAELRHRYPNFEPTSVVQQPWINNEEALRQFREGLEALESIAPTQRALAMKFT
jgi:adenylate cyclase